jgi:hypothetical protein
LEINEAMLQRDKALKLELDVANSLHADMTTRLTMHQRSIKQLTEKVRELEAAEAVAQKKHDSELHHKVLIYSIFYISSVL